MDTDVSRVLTGHEDSVLDVVWSPDGRMLASAGRDGTVRLWSAEGDGQEVFRLREIVSTVAFSRDARLLAAGTKDGLVRIWDLSSLTPIVDGRCGAAVDALLFLDRSKRLLIGTGDGSILAWSSAPHLEELRRVGRPILALRAAPDESWLAVSGLGGVMFLDERMSEAFPGFQPSDRVEAYDCAIAPDAETCASALRCRNDGSLGRTDDPDLFEIALWRPPRGEEPLSGENLVAHTAWIRRVDFSPDGRLLASASFDRSVRLWDYRDLRELSLLHGHGAAVYSARFSPDSARLATSSADRTIRLWRLDRVLPTGQQRHVVVGEDVAPRADQIGTDRDLAFAEQLAEALVAIQSTKDLQAAVADWVPATEIERARFLIQVSNIRAEQARREGDLERVRQWRRVQTEVYQRGWEFSLGLMVHRGLNGEEDTPAVLDQLSGLSGRRRRQVERVVVECLAVLDAVRRGELHLADAERRLTERRLDALALFMVIGKLQGEVPDVLAGRSDAAPLRAAAYLVSRLVATADPVVAASAYELVGVLTCFTGANEEGLSWLELALRQARQGDWAQLRCSVLGNLGNALRNLGRFDEARDAYEEALAIARDRGLPDEFVAHSTNLALVYNDVGDLGAEFSQLRQAVAVCRMALSVAGHGEAGGPDPDDGIYWRYAGCLMGLADVYREFGDEESEEECYREALKIAKDIDDRRMAAACVGNLGDIERRKGRYELAEEHYKQSLAVAEAVGNADGQVHSLGGLAMLRLHAGRLDEERELLSQGARIAREHGLWTRLVGMLKSVAAAAVEAGDAAEATAVLEEAARVADRLHQDVHNADEAPGVQQAVAGVTARLAALYLDAGRHLDAFETVERTRAGMLVRALRDSQPGEQAPYTTSDVLDALRRVGSRAVLVSYYQLADRLAVFLLRADDGRLQSVGVPVPPGHLADIRRDFHRQVVRQFARREAEETWLRLSDLVVEPIAPYLRDGDLLLLAPHGALHGLPLHATRAGDGRLIDRWPVAYVPSASALVALTAGSLRPVRRAAVFGSYFEDEARSVARLLQTTPVVGEGLDKRAVLRSLERNDVVHLSAHGFHLPERPRQSGLLLDASEETEAWVRALARPLRSTWAGQRLELADLEERLGDAVLNVDDLAGVRSNARLVTLSACESGLVGTDAADDPVGLVPALLTAGARGVVATLWLVDADATAVLMQQFYSQLAQAGGFDRIPFALREAVLTMRKREQHTHAWASVVLVGGVGISGAGGG